MPSSGGLLSDEAAATINSVLAFLDSALAWLLALKQVHQYGCFASDCGLERRFALERPLRRMQLGEWRTGLERGLQLRRVYGSYVQQHRPDAGQSVLREIFRGHLRWHLDHILGPKRYNVQTAKGERLR